MKLPEDKQQRTKLLIVIALASILVILGITHGIIGPSVKYKKDLRARLADNSDQVAAAKDQIRRVSRAFAADRERVARIVELSDEHVLHPVIGNYLLSATEIIEKHAQALDLKTAPLREVGISEIPRPRKSKIENALKCYAVRVSLSCGYDDLCKLLTSLEQDNPYLTITGLGITGQPDTDPERHSVTFDIQWPVWADPGTPDELRQQLNSEVTIKADNGA